MAACGLNTIGGMWLVVAVAVVAVVVIWAAVTYNRLVRTRNRTENAWAQVDVQLQRRYDLVPNLVETVRGYAEHEGDTLEAVIAARNTAQDASSIVDQAADDNVLTGALRQMFALSESYPELRASENFHVLQVELSDIEGDIVVARQIYNDTTLTYNNAVETVPTSLVAGIAGFEPMMFYQVEGEGRSVPKVEF